MNVHSPSMWLDKGGEAVGNDMVDSISMSALQNLLLPINIKNDVSETKNLPRSLYKPDLT